MIVNMFFLVLNPFVVGELICRFDPPWDAHKTIGVKIKGDDQIDFSMIHLQRLYFRG